jgi:hypothetical protein
MADGIHCKYCGFYESDHDLGGRMGNKETAEELLPEKGLTLNQCLKSHGFTPEDPILAEELAKKSREEKLAHEMCKRRFGGYS